MSERVQLNVMVPEQLSQQIRTVALIEGRTVTELVVETLEALVAARKGDGEFQALKRRKLDEFRAAADLV